jgi:glyoxylase-like metal-dependent hydrolase (beta-lactamase superfamily II)
MLYQFNLHGTKCLIQVNGKMKVHHLNCGSMCPWAGKYLSSILPNKLSCHCLLIETNDGLVLVDAGLSEADILKPSRLGLSSLVLGTIGDTKEAAINQIKRLGFSPEDVRHIIPTHLDLDHAGGIVDFPNAKIHTLEKEFKVALNPRSITERGRYRQCQWNKDTNWVVHKDYDGEKWFGFDSVRKIDSLPPEILLIPLHGHTKGHFGIAVQTKDKWILHAGDAFYDQSEVEGNEKTIIGWKLFQKAVHSDYQMAMQNQARIRDLIVNHSPDVDVLCAHDIKKFESYL